MQELFSFGSLQFVNHMHWQDQDKDISSDREDGIGVPGVHEVVAVSWDVLLPGFVYRSVRNVSCRPFFLLSETLV